MIAFNMPEEMGVPRSVWLTAFNRLVRLAVCVAVLVSEASVVKLLISKVIFGHT